MNFDAVLFQES